MYVFVPTATGVRLMKRVRRTITLRGGKSVTVTCTIRPVLPPGTRQTVPVGIMPPRRPNPAVRARNWQLN